MEKIIRKKIVLYLLFIFLSSNNLFSDVTSLEQAVNKEIAKIKKELILIRRRIHQNPELSNREFQTSKFVAGYLKKLGIEVKTGVAHTGVIGLLKGHSKGITVALRADMDALPIQELNDVPYKSRRKGVMHACGHDVHTTIALGVASVLSKMKDKIKGNIKFIFQPAEEGAPPGEEGGASLMIKEGVLENPEVSAIFGLHVFPLLNLGTAGYRSGAFMAQSNRFEIEIIGKNAHGATPHLGIDAIVIASEVVMAIQTIPSRLIDAREPVVISVGVIEGGSRFNIIADKVKLIGTVRIFSKEMSKKVKIEMEKIIKGITEIYGARYKFQYVEGAPPVYNNPSLTEKSVKIMKKVLGAKNVILLEPQMVAEDFSYYGEKIPSFFYFLGVRNEEKGITNMLHTPYFNVDEECIPIGVKLMSYLLINYLENMEEE